MAPSANAKHVGAALAAKKLRPQTNDATQRQED